MKRTKVAAVLALTLLPLSAAACSSDSKTEQVPSNNTVLDNPNQSGGDAGSSNPSGANSVDQSGGSGSPQASVPGATTTTTATAATQP